MAWFTSKWFSEAWYGEDWFGYTTPSVPASVTGTITGWWAANWYAGSWLRENWYGGTGSGVSVGPGWCSNLIHYKWEGIRRTRNRMSVRSYRHRGRNKF